MKVGETGQSTDKRMLRWVDILVSVEILHELAHKRTELLTEVSYRYMVMRTLFLLFLNIGQIIDDRKSRGVVEVRLRMTQCD